MFVSKSYTMKQIFILLTLALTLITLSSCQKFIQVEEGALVPLTVIDDPTLPSININGINLHAESFGNPSHPMVIAIHGGPGADYRGILNFKELVELGIFVVFYDQRGSGLSERLDASYYKEVQVYIEELDGVIQHFRSRADQQVVLAGHSWGAMLATAYINQFPDNIEGVILAEPGGLTWDQTLEYFSKVVALKPFQEATNDFVFMDQILTGEEHSILDYKLGLSSASNNTGDDQLSLPFWRYGAVCNMASLELAQNNPEDMNFTTNLVSYNKKVLFAFSELNHAYGQEHAELLSSSFNKVQLVEIPNCGHEIIQFGWKDFHPIIKTYLTEIL